jgi:hypothetical protein
MNSVFDTNHGLYEVVRNMGLVESRWYCLFSCLCRTRTALFTFYFSVFAGWGLQFLLCVVHKSCMSTVSVCGLHCDARWALIWPESTHGLNGQPCGGEKAVASHVLAQCVPLCCVWERCFLSILIWCLPSQPVQPRPYQQVHTFHLVFSLWLHFRDCVGQDM